MADQFQFRHHDYVLQVPSYPGGQVVRYSLQLDTDSSFILRGRAIHTQTTQTAIAGSVPTPLANQVAALNQYTDRITGPDSNDLSDGLVNFYFQSAILGQYGLPLPVRAPLLYPPGCTLFVDVYNPTALTNLEIYFRGQKIFQPGVLPCNTYPPSAFIRPRWFTTFETLVVAPPPSLNNSLMIDSFADFALRTLSIGAYPGNSGFGAHSYNQVWIQLRDQNGRAYSNVPVHVDVCFGSTTWGNFRSGEIYGIPSNNLPPLLTPEIYIPANQILYYDLYRNDAYDLTVPGPVATADMQLSWGGAQVRAK